MDRTTDGFESRMPTFDRDGYPTDETLEIIADMNAWPWDAYKDWMVYCGQAYDEGYGKIRETPKTLVFVTGGWSGNESVLMAMSENFMFNRFRRAWKRGGMEVWESVAEAEACIERGKAQQREWDKAMMEKASY